jgi:polysaccharide deacetylase 2 family uncharacterized protein YibQ
VPRLQSIRRLLGALGIAALLLLGLIYALSRSPADQPNLRGGVSSPGAKRLGSGAERPIRRSCTPAAPCLAVLIDDLGRHPRRLRQLLALPLDVTYSVLPHAQHSALAMLAVRAAQREYWLHLPLEPTNRQSVTDETVVLSSAGSIEAGLLTSLAALPGALGVTSHMGSAFTADEQAVRRLLRQMKPLGLPLLDSKTHCRERGLPAGAAAERSLPRARRVLG